MNELQRPEFADLLARRRTVAPGQRGPATPGPPAHQQEERQRRDQRRRRVRHRQHGVARHREVAQREPVAVTSHDRVTGYFVSRADYEAYLRMKARMPMAYPVEALSEETIQAIAASSMDVRHLHLNQLLDD